MKWTWDSLSDAVIRRPVRRHHHPQPSRYWRVNPLPRLDPAVGGDLTFMRWRRTSRSVTSRESPTSRVKTQGHYHDVGLAEPAWDAAEPQGAQDAYPRRRVA